MNSRYLFFKLFYKKIICILLLFFLLLGLMFLDISLGYEKYSFSDILKTIFYSDFVSKKVNVIIWDYRIPVAVMATLVGMMLALSGSQMQTILNNSLADPFTLGISSAASFGAALSIVYPIQLIPFLEDIFIATNAFVFAISSALLIYGFSKMKNNTSTETIILFGLSLFFVFNALQSILQYTTSENQLQEIIFWTMGSFNSSSLNKIKICFLILIFSLIFFFYYSSHLTALRFGENSAKSFGVDVKSLKMKSLIVISLLAAASVSFVGIIGFIGLIGPHIGRNIVGEDHRFFIPASMLIGGILLSISSIISKNIFQGIIIPVGIISSLLGLPLFIYLLFKGEKKNYL